MRGALKLCLSAGITKDCWRSAWPRRPFDRFGLESIPMARMRHLGELWATQQSWVLAESRHVEGLAPLPPLISLVWSAAPVPETWSRWLGVYKCKSLHLDLEYGGGPGS